MEPSYRVVLEAAQAGLAVKHPNESLVLERGVDARPSTVRKLATALGVEHGELVKAS